MLLSTPVLAVALSTCGGGTPASVTNHTGDTADTAVTAPVTATGDTGDTAPQGSGLPVADASMDQAVFVGTVIQLSGAGSYTPQGDPIEGFFWRFVSRPSGSNAMLSGASVPGSAATPAFVADLAGMYVLELRVEANGLDSEPDLVAITATDPP